MNAFITAGCFALAALCSSAFAEDVVTIRRVPNGGMKPSAAVDEAGVLHLVYFAGKPQEGDAFYTTSRDGGATFSAPVRVNSEPRSVLGVSGIRGPRLTLGREGQVHIAWNGSSVAMPKGPLNPAMPADSPFNGTPLLYSHLAGDGKSFEPQRNLMQRTCALDGGGDVAADREGRVFVVFHAQLPGAKSEGERAVWVATSMDDGRTFAEEKNVLPEPTGVCACCALAARVSEDGALAILYRGATGSVQRGMHLLVSHDHATTFDHTQLDEWKLATCPMSSAALMPGPKGFLSAWENAGRIQIDDGGGSKSADSEGEGQKLPVIARRESTGEMLIAWTEGMGWNKGGALVWRYSKGSEDAVKASGRKDDVPANGSIAAVALADGKFVVFY
jgi:hypothetical protein